MAAARPVTAGHGRIAIAGGSIAGLFAAVLLRRRGWDVDVYERASAPLSGRGAGIVIHGPLFAALEAAGLPAAQATVGVPSVGRAVFARDGSVIARQPMAQTHTSWSLVFRMLREALPDSAYHAGARLNDVSPAPGGGVRLVFEGGTQAAADWLVAADGLRSTLRERCMPGCGLAYAGYVAWRGLVEERLLDPALTAALAGRMNFALPAGEQMLVYLVAGPGDDLRPGHRWVNWVWYRPVPAGDALQDLLTDAAGRHHEAGIAPAAIRDSHVENLLEAADRRLPPQFATLVNHTGRPFIQPVQDGTSTHMRHGRILFIGDAAFTARPHVGMGVSKAAADAHTLADALEPPDAAREVALAAWDDARSVHGQAVVDWGRRLGSYLGPDGINSPEGAHYAEPDTVMAQVAAADPERYALTR